jgi:spore germination protein YaaH
MLKKMMWMYLFTLNLGILAVQAQSKALFYMTTGQTSVRSFLQHADKIDILEPTWYRVDKDGMVWGGPDPTVIDTAKAHHVSVMPIVSGTAFKPDIYHGLFINEVARKEFISDLLRECRLNGYVGFQIDFEGIQWTDRDALTNLVAEAAAALHASGYKLSIATVPNAPGYAGQTGYGYWIYRDWRAAYNLEGLAKAVDFICLMTYDQNTSYTPPGPVAGFTWMVENLDYALKFVPKKKLFLGIPLYGYHWYAGIPVNGQNKPNIKADSISAPDAIYLATAYKGQLQWDATDRTAWFYFYRDDIREWVFFTDKRTFQERYRLAQHYGVEGFCSWVLGTEDPAIWSVLPSHT